MIYKSQIENVKPEQVINSDMKLIVPTSSPAIGNTPVVGSTVYLMDCVEGMKHYPDKYFDLAIVDPPYGIDKTRKLTGNGYSCPMNAMMKEMGRWDVKPSY